MSERTFSSDSGLEQSGDELEATREVEVHEAEEESMEDLNVALPEEEDTEEEEDFSRVEDEMMSIFRKITGPLRRARQRKYSAEKLETEIATIK